MIKKYIPRIQSEFKKFVSITKKKKINILAKKTLLFL